MTGGSACRCRVVADMWAVLVFSLNQHGMPFGLGPHGRERGETEGDRGVTAVPLGGGGVGQ